MRPALEGARRRERPAGALLDALARRSGCRGSSAPSSRCARRSSSTARSRRGASGRRGRRFATFGLALAALHDAALERAGAGGAAAALAAGRARPRRPLTSARLRVDERILHLLAGVDGMDPRVAGCVRPVARPRRCAVAGGRPPALAARALAAARRVALCGGDGRRGARRSPRGGRRLGLARAGRARATRSRRGSTDAARPAPVGARGGAGRVALSSSSADDVRRRPDAAARARALRRPASPAAVATSARDRCAGLERPGAAARRRAARRTPSSGRCGRARSATARLDVDGGSTRSPRSSTSEAARSRAVAARRRRPATATRSRPLWRRCRVAGAAAARRPRAAHRAGAPAGTTSCCPSRSAPRCSQIAAQVRRAHDGLRALGFARAGARGLGIAALFAGASGHRQDDGRRGAGRRARPRPVPDRPQRGGEQVHRRDREEPAARVRGRRGQRRDPALRRGRRAVRQAHRGRATATTATPTSRSATCSSGWRPTAASPS